MKHAIRPVGACLVATLLFLMRIVAPSQPLPTGRRSAGTGQIRAAHFFGLSRYSWPINYLSAFQLANVDRDLAQIAGDGFNAIVLLVPWGEIQPSLGPPAIYNEAALSRLQLLVASARAHDLQVILRVPYIWSMNPGQEMPNIERITALLFDDRVRAAFFDAIRTIDRRVVRPNSNVRFVFATWEDFYGVTAIPEKTPEGVRERFSRYAHQRYSAKELTALYRRPLDGSQRIPIPNRNEPGWQVFLAYIDENISALTRRMADALSVPLSFEVRVDPDPVLVDGRIADRYAHEGTYDVDTSDVTTMYFATYMGQANVGERITADQAMANMRNVMEAVGQHTRNRLFIDQFNVVFNTPGFDRHARIKDTELAGFLDRAAPYLAVETLGYGIWSYKGYYRNLFYNPRFELGLSGWEAEGAVQSTPTGVLLAPGAAIRQTVAASLVMTSGQSPQIDICVWGSSSPGGTVTLSTIGGTRVIDLSASQASPANCAVLPRQAADYSVTFRAADKTVRLEGAVFNSHTEVAGLYDVEGRQTSLRDMIVRFNRAMTDAPKTRCPEAIPADGVLAGKYSDGWLTRRARACLTVPRESADRLELSLFVPAPVPVPVHGTLTAADVRQPFALVRGANTVTMAPVDWPAGTEVPVVISFEDEFVPSDNGSSTDSRALTARFKGIGFRSAGTFR